MEFDLIARIRSRARRRGDVVLGIGDDAALLAPATGQVLVVSTDTLNAGVHFADGDPPAAIGWKALAVNLSDLAAMGASPAWCTLSLSLPEVDDEWIAALLDGFFELADAHGVALVGGDTTRGPLSLCVTAIGQVAPGRALRRDAARVGDGLWVSGTLGDAAAALGLGRTAPGPLAPAARHRAPAGPGVAVDPFLRGRLLRPTPRLALGGALGGLAHACIDVSDGLLADLGHICAASGVSAEVELAALPASPALRDTGDEVSRRSWQAAGGDDYELCFTAAPEAAGAVAAAAATAGVQVTRIGRIVAADQVPRVRLLDGSGHDWSPSRRGYEHFHPHT